MRMISKSRGSGSIKTQWPLYRSTMKTQEMKSRIYSTANGEVSGFHPFCFHFLKLGVLVKKRHFCFSVAGSAEDLEESYGWQFATQVSMDHHVLRRLDTVTRIRLFLDCHCRLPDVRVTHCFIYVAHKDKLTVVPALRNFDVNRMEFDEEYFNTVLMRTGNRPSFRFGIPQVPNFSAFARPAKAQNCLKCMGTYTVRSINIPDSTWLLIVECPDSLKKATLRHFETAKETRANGVAFRLAWILLLEKGSHFVSLHCYDNKWYFYDDLHEARMVRIDPQRFEIGNRDCIRAFYYREAERNPHRCLKRLDSSDSTGPAPKVIEVVQT